MKILAALALSLALALPAAAQEGPSDPFKDVKLGDRVELTLKSNFAIQGQIITVDPHVTEIEKMKVITLDVNLEYPELTGHIGVERSQVRSVRKLPKLSAAELEARDKARQAAMKRMADEDNARRARMAERELEIEKARLDEAKRKKEKEKEGILGDVKEQAEMIAKGGAIFAKFPPAAGWGPAKLEEIANKNTLKIPISDEEREFLLNYDLWAKYKAYKEEQDLKARLKAASEAAEEAKKKAEEEKKKEEKKTETPETPK